MNFTEKQFEAINTIEQNLQIIACAGSGKTGVVTERVVKILKTKKDIKPKNIVAFTYTEKAAGELKTRIYKRVKEELGDINGMADMYIGTIHSYCLKLLRDTYSQYNKFVVLDEVKTKIFIDKNAYNLGIHRIPSTTGKFMRPYLDTNLYMAMISILRESELEDRELAPELQDTLDKYNQLFESHSYFDFTMIMERAIHHLEDDELLRKKVSTRLKFLTVDEYQDINPIQEKLIRLLYQLGANLCVVGDDDQTIYQWRGSDVTNILTFKDRYKIKEPVYLVDNFRSSNGIVDVAKRVIANNSKRMIKDIVYQSQYTYEEGDILYKEFTCENDEYQFIADRIKDLHQAGLKYSDIAILLRIKNVGGPLIEVLKNNNIDFIVEGVNELFLTDEAIAASAIYEYLHEEMDENELITKWQTIQYKLNEKDLKKGILYLEKIEVKEDGYYSSFNLQKIFHDFIDLINLKEEEGGRNNKLEVILYNMGKFSQVIDDFESIYYTTRPKTRLKQFCNFLKYTAQNYYPEGHLQNVYIKPEAVRIMTIHQAKGLEFPVVFIPTLTKNKFPQKKHGGPSVWHYLDKNMIKNQERYESGDVEDERRLFYVAVTRAKKFLFLSRAEYNKQAKYISTFLVEAKKSPFILEYDSRINYTKRKKLQGDDRGDAEIILNFSVLQDYYHCLYHFKLTYFYGFVQPLSPRLGYGRSLHDIVMDLHRGYTDAGDVPKELLSAMIDRNFYLPYADKVINKELKEKAVKSVDQYYDDNYADFNKIVFSEKEIELDFGNGIRVNGRIDLVKRMEMDGERTFIVDFKTAERPMYLNISEEQLKIYALGYKKLSGEDADYMEFYNLDTNEQDRKRLNADDLQKTSEKIVSAANNIRSDKLEKKCIKERCKSCYMSHICLHTDIKQNFGIK
ncbi:MAG: ATP-dependent helicase [Spirochaetes bacterium]|jgi:DNA helicase-2/ATP-dependent DNA helicase PcrA|nr:ATP-dependent helicase [Spirochaetota bacterium]